MYYTKSKQQQQQQQMVTIGKWYTPCANKKNPSPDCDVEAKMFKVLKGMNPSGDQHHVPQ
jgi:hypothetical protein